MRNIKNNQMLNARFSLSMKKWSYKKLLALRGHDGANLASFLYRKIFHHHTVVQEIFVSQDTVKP